MISEFKLLTHFCLKGPKNLFQLAKSSNQRTSYGFCQDLIVNAHGTKKYVRISESSNYQVFALTGVNCISYPGGHSIVKNTGGWLDSLGSGILVEKIFWGSSKILVWAIVRG